MRNTMTIITANAIKEIKHDDYSMDLLREIIEDITNADTEAVMTEYFDAIVIFKDDKAEMAANSLIEQLNTDRIIYTNDYDNYDEESDADSVGLF